MPNISVRSRFKLAQPILVSIGRAKGSYPRAKYAMPRLDSYGEVFYTRREMVDRNPPRDVRISPGESRVTHLKAILTLAVSEDDFSQLTSGPSDLNAIRAFRLMDFVNLVGNREAPTMRFLFRCYYALHTCLAQTLDRLRDEFGQFWLEHLPAFVEEDQAVGRLGPFFTRARCEWSIDGRSWRKLRLPVVESGPELWIRQTPLNLADWQRLADSASLRRSDLTLHLLSRSLRQFFERDYRTCVITAVTALDREVHRFVKTQLSARGVSLAADAVDELGKRAGLSYLNTEPRHAIGT